MKEYSLRFKGSWSVKKINNCKLNTTTEVSSHCWVILHSYSSTWCIIFLIGHEWLTIAFWTECCVGFLQHCTADTHHNNTAWVLVFTSKSPIGCLLLILTELVLIKHSVLCESAKPTISSQSTNTGCMRNRLVQSVFKNRCMFKWTSGGHNYCLYKSEPCSNRDHFMSPIDLCRPLFYESFSSKIMKLLVPNRLILECGPTDSCGTKKLTVLKLHPCWDLGLFCFNMKHLEHNHMKGKDICCSFLFKLVC